MVAHFPRVRWLSFGTVITDTPGSADSSAVWLNMAVFKEKIDACGLKITVRLDTSCMHFAKEKDVFTNNTAIKRMINRPWTPAHSRHNLSLKNSMKRRALAGSSLVSLRA